MLEAFLFWQLSSAAHCVWYLEVELKALSKAKQADGVFTLSYLLPQNHTYQFIVYLAI